LRKKESEKMSFLEQVDKFLELCLQQQVIIKCIQPADLQSIEDVIESEKKFDEIAYLESEMKKHQQVFMWLSVLRGEPPRKPAPSPSRKPAFEVTFPQRLPISFRFEQAVIPAIDPIPEVEQPAVLPSIADMQFENVLRANPLGLPPPKFGKTFHVPHQQPVNQGDGGFYPELFEDEEAKEQSADDQDEERPQRKLVRLLPRLDDESDDDVIIISSKTKKEEDDDDEEEEKDGDDDDNDDDASDESIDEFIVGDDESIEEYTPEELYEKPMQRSGNREIDELKHEAKNSATYKVAIEDEAAKKTRKDRSNMYSGLTSKVLQAVGGNGAPLSQFVKRFVLNPTNFSFGSNTKRTTQRLSEIFDGRVEGVVSVTKVRNVMERCYMCLSQKPCAAYIHVDGRHFACGTECQKQLSIALKAADFLADVNSCIKDRTSANKKEEWEEAWLEIEHSLEVHNNMYSKKKK
jgi:hypothetical protein